MTIDELAREAAISVSTVRLYQHRGLLDPPDKRGRVGYYGAAHLARLRLVAQLQARGFSLASIGELARAVDRGESLPGILGLGTVGSAEARRMSLAELTSELPAVDITPDVVQRVIDLGLVELVPGSTDVVVRDPAVLHIGRELAALGVPGDEILDQFEALRADAERISARFVDTFRHHVWPSVAADPGTDIVTLLGRLSGLAESVTSLALRTAIRRDAERFVATEAAELGIDVPT